jgi:hypothetical protein
LKETELLRNAFDTFRARVIDDVTRYRDRQAQIVARLGIDGLASPTGPTPDEIANWLVAGLTAMARARLMNGEHAAVLAAIPKMVPRALRRPTDAGFDLLEGLPNPDELASAAARLVRNALYAADGRVLHMQMPATPDRMPEIVTSAEIEPPLEERIMLTFRVEPVWTWEHGFYGEPRTVFPPHDDLNGFTTTDRDSDPGLANDGDWPDTAFYAPNDHDGCTCEWVIDTGGGE